MAKSTYRTEPIMPRDWSIQETPFGSSTVELPPFTVNDDGCWITRYVPMKNGYVAIRRWKLPTVLAHRLFYTAIIGPIPEGLDLDHVKTRGCRSRACVNPGHLEPVNRRENLRRGNTPNQIRHERGTCDNGHPYAIYAYRDARGHVAYCRLCHKKPRPVN